MTLQPPQWELAAGFALLAVVLVLALKARLRGKEVWRYDTTAAWLRAFAYFAACWSIAAASGTLNTIANNPLVPADQLDSVVWWLFTAVILAIVVVGYWIVWPIGTKPHGRRIVWPDTPFFGVAWGVSEGLLMGSVWLLAVRAFGDHGDGHTVLKGVGVAAVTIVVLSLFVGLWHALYWDVHVSPEHNIIEWNIKKVMYAHNPNILLSVVWLTVYDDVGLFVLFQSLALLGSVLAMPFPSGRFPHPPDPTRPVLGDPVRIGSADMTGKVVVVTGGAGGIGSVVVRRLAAQGAHVVVVDVRLDAAEALASDVRASTGATVDALACDLTSNADVRRVAAELSARYPHIDVLINNAGRFTTRYAESVDGHEVTLAVNHLGHFLLTQLLLDRLTTSGARILFTSTDAHWQAKEPDWDDLNNAKAWKGKPGKPDSGAGFVAYNQSKLILTAVAMELAERTDGTGVTVNVVCPGALIPAGIYDELTGPMAWAMRALRPILRTPDKASQGLVHLASSPEVEGITGWYWKDVRAIDESLLAQDPALRARLWDWSVDAVGLEDALTQRTPLRG
jgi:retinol dehydrogenase-14